MKGKCKLKLLIFVAVGLLVSTLGFAEEHKGSGRDVVVSTSILDWITGLQLRELRPVPIDLPPKFNEPDCVTLTIEVPGPHLPKGQWLSFCGVPDGTNWTVTPVHNPKAKRPHRWALGAYPAVYYGNSGGNGPETYTLQVDVLGGGKHKTAKTHDYVMYLEFDTSDGMPKSVQFTSPPHASDNDLLEEDHGGGASGNR